MDKKEKQLIEIFKKAVKDEPELSGKPPKDLLEAFKKGDEKIIISTLKVVVRLTKMNILERFETELKKIK